ncbi:Acyl-thioesterase [Pleurostoma richardsiae]|uniref:Acyl-thioesterase n=1 Tax=Pleurostoma richardsiae TaxID=41990 RepID=A0AA38RMB7_9PEZI|nr:Acyl-thioesterase [Pleurostoma richardsiae]
MDADADDAAAFAANYWKQVREFEEGEDRRALEDYHRKSDPIKQQLTKLLTERNKVAVRLRELRAECDKVEAKLKEVDLEYETAKKKMAERRAQRTLATPQWLEAEFGKGSPGAGSGKVHDDGDDDDDVPSGADGSSHGMTDPIRPGAENEKGVDDASGEPANSRAVGLQDAESAATNGERDTGDGSGRPTGVQIVDSEGVLVTTLKTPKASNVLATLPLGFRIGRAVRMRQAGNAAAELVKDIHDPGKENKWLACATQATGDVQAEKCQCCLLTKSGPFPECIRLAADRTCGNCEWDGLQCIGAAFPPQHSDLQQRPRSSHSQVGTPVSMPRSPAQKAPGQPSSTPSAFTPVNGHLATSPNRQAGAGSHTRQKQPGRRSLPNEKGGKVKQAVQPCSDRSDSGPIGEAPLEAADAREGTEEGVVGAEGLEDPGPEISAASLSLVHNGTVYTEPEIMRGVPVKRITPDDDYWDPQWEIIEDKVQPKLADWRAKLEMALKEGKKKDLANRQINRGNAIMEFLQGGPIHPYQFVAKKFITTHLITYDTLFRLVATLTDELPKFSLDVTPLDWLRQRMHELQTAQGESFNLARTIHNMYHDPKLVALRAKAGFGNIGRPSGSKAVPKLEQDTPATPSKKRKSTDPTLESSKKRVRRSSLLAKEDDQSVADTNNLTVTPRSARKKKKQRALQQTESPTNDSMGPADVQGPLLSRLSMVSSEVDAEDDFDVDGYTTSDTFSMDRVTEIDWRISQVKTIHRTSSSDITQYWHWVAESELFEHQVLKEVKPASWGVYKEPIDFHLRLRELVKVEFSNNSLKIAIHTKPIKDVKHRGVLVARFNRHRTRKRFLSFMLDLGVVLSKVSSSQMEHTWKTLKSDELPDTDSES